jgi:hypothetical protein
LLKFHVTHRMVRRTSSTTETVEPLEKTMATHVIEEDLGEHIAEIRLVDTHEHMGKEEYWLNDASADILCDTFENYVIADFVSAGCSDFEAVLRDSDASLAERWAKIEPAWQNIRLTGYGEAVSDIFRAIYDHDEIDLATLENAQARMPDLKKAGERYRLLHEVAHLDHIQTDDFCWPCLPDASGPEFFLYDLGWSSICNGNPHLQAMTDETGVQVKDLASYGEAMQGLFAKYGPCAIAVKSQHAYSRTLDWQAREDSDAEAVLQKLMREEPITVEETLCLGDWGWARGVELAGKHNLPFKIHTGYYAGNGGMPMSRIPSRNLCDLVIAYPETRFVLMHISYPYSDELIAMTKHFPNVYADLCWAWSINPLHSMDFVRRFIHAAPVNKLFAFGGDTFRPTSAVGYAVQTRRWLTRALTAEVSDGYLSMSQAKQVASKIMHDNQYECFDIESTRSAIALAGEL